VREDLKKRDLLDDIAWNIIRGKVTDLLVKSAEIRET